MEDLQDNYSVFTQRLEPYPPKRKLKILRHTLSPYIVRNVTGGIYGRQSYPEEQFQRLYEEFVDIGENSAQHLKRVQEQGINIAPTYFVAGTDSFNYLRLYSVTKEVKGHDLSTYQHLKGVNEERLAVVYNDLISSLCSYYENQFLSNQMVMDDIADLHQYKISMANNNPTIYLIDTDINISEPCPELARVTLNKLNRSTSILNSKFRSNVFLEQSYLSINNLKNSIL